MWTVYEMANRRGPGAVYKYWAWYGGSGFGWPPRRTGGERVAGSLLAPGLPQAVRVVLSLRPLVSGSHLFAVLFGSTVGTFYVSLQRLVGGAVLGQRCARFSLCNDRCQVVRTFLLCAEAVPHGPALHFHGAVFGQGCCCARCWSTTGAPVPQLQFSTVIDTPVFAQWLIPMVLTIEVSQLQFDKVVFVPVVQNVQFILPSTSLPWRRGWFPWSCMSKTIEIPPVAVHGVVDVPVMLWLQVPQVRMVLQVQFSVEAPQLAPDLAF